VTVMRALIPGIIAGIALATSTQAVPLSPNPASIDLGATPPIERPNLQRRDLRVEQAARRGGTRCAAAARTIIGDGAAARHPPFIVTTRPEPDGTVEMSESDAAPLLRAGWVKVDTHG
jgi:hypothetical protein